MLSTETLPAKLWNVANHVLACLVHAIGKKYNSTESKVNWIDEKSTEYMKSDLKLKELTFQWTVIWPLLQELSFLQNYKSSHQRCSINKVFLKISQSSQENTCARDSFLLKL